MTDLAIVSTVPRARRLVPFIGSRTTPDHCAARDALAAVPLDDRGRVYAAATVDAWREQWASHYALRKSPAHPCIARLIGRRCGHGYWRPRPDAVTCRPPYDDHPTLWLRDGQAVVYVSEPYGLHLDGLREIVAFADQHALDVSVDSASTYFPSATTRVLYFPRNLRCNTCGAPTHSYAADCFVCSNRLHPKGATDDRPDRH